MVNAEQPAAYSLVHDIDQAQDSDSFLAEFTSENMQSDNTSIGTFVSEEEETVDNAKEGSSSEICMSSDLSSCRSASDAANRPQQVAGPLKDLWADAGMPLEKAVVTTGFTTGNKRVITVKEESLQKMGRNLEENDFGGAKKVRTDAGAVCKSGGPRRVATGTDKENRSATQNVRNTLERTEDAYLRRMKEIFVRVRNNFPKEDKRWVFEQFKWAWLSLSKVERSDDAVSLITAQMKVRKQKEHSVLRRIVEGDDVACRYMVLLVIEAQPQRIQVFDGFYSVFCTLNADLAKRVGCKKIGVGMKIKVFGANPLLPGPMGVLDQHGDVLHLFSNSVRVACSTKKLGYQKKSSFRMNVDDLSRHGGMVSCVEVDVRKILEDKVFVRCGNYKKVVDMNKVEREVEKMNTLARSCDAEIKTEEITARKFVKLVVGDATGECVLTWWCPEDVRVGATYRLISLRTVESTLGVHITTTGRTYVKKLR